MVETSDVDHGGSPSVRTCEVERTDPGKACGFHLTRSRWDPYPWVSGVDSGSAAEVAGLKPGDCVLEVNGEDVLGQRIAAVAERVRARPDRVVLELWNAGSDPACSPESLCCGPMPGNLERLSACLRAILAVLECPVCLDTIPPPAHQCVNGHLICVRCRVRTERCPVCRVRFCRGRSLLADQVYNSLTDAFQVRGEDQMATLRKRLLGTSKKKATPTNKFLTRLMGKSHSVENLSSDPVTLTSLPRHIAVASEFNSTLKAKSLSSSEIFRPQSPGPAPVSRSPSANSLRPKRPASYHGSSESLFSDFGESYPQIHDDGSLYHCPCEAECVSLLKASSVMSHIQDYHEGPLVQYFKPRMLLSLPLALEQSAVVTVSTHGAVFFLRVARQLSDDWLVWVWLLGAKRDADCYRLVLTLRGGAHEVTYTTPVLSLSSASWTDICKSRRGIYFSADSQRQHFPSEMRTQCPLGMLVEIQAEDDSAR